MAIGLNSVILLALAVGVILLQVFLSKRSGKWFGLILPAVFFIVSLLIVISMVAYTNIGITSHSVSEDGAIVSSEIVDTTPAFGSVVGQVVITFLLANIPTVVLLVIYAACREKRKQIQNLE